MKEEIRKVLEMLESGQLNADQAAELLEAMDAFDERRDTKPPLVKRRTLRIKVSSADGDTVNVKVPAALVSAGVSIGRFFADRGGEDNSALKDLDWDELAAAVKQMLEDGDIGEIVNIVSTERDNVDIWLE